MRFAIMQKIDCFSPRLRVFAPYFVLALATFAAYANVFQNGFLFDDELIIKINSYIQDWDHIGDILTKSTINGAHIVGGFYRPLQMLLYLFAYHAGDGGTFWFHALNLALHIANVCLVYKLGTALKFDPKGAFFAALLWGVHPIHTEAVTYMSGTADPLYVFFCLWALVVLIPDFSLRAVGKSIPLFLLAVASKETAVVFPLLVVVCVFYVSPKRFSIRSYLATLPLWGLSLIYVYWRTHVDGFDGPQAYARLYAMPEYAELRLYAAEPFYRIYTFLATLPEYLKLLLVPTHLHMERTFPVQTSFVSGLVAGGFAMVVFAFGHIAYSLRIRRFMELSWGFLWFGAAYAPNSGLLLPMNSLFLEHWMYLPSIGLFLGSAQILVLFAKAQSRAVLPAAGIAVAAAVTLAAMSHVQNNVWRNPETFFTNVFRNGEPSARGHNNLALYYYEKNRLDDAIAEFNRAIASADIYAETQFNLANIYFRKDYPKASIEKGIEHLKRSIEIQPNFYRSYGLLSDAYAYLNDKEKADMYRKKALELYSQQ